MEDVAEKNDFAFEAELDGADASNGKVGGVPK